jgi:biopolymer transport protein ExbD
MRLDRWICFALALAFSTACESEPKRNPFDRHPDQAKPLPKTSAAPEPEGPPDFEIDQVGAKVGFERTMTDKPDGLQQLRQALEKNKQYVQGQDIVLRVDRQAKREWVVSYIKELSAAGAKTIKLKTETRNEYPNELVFVPEDQATNAPGCSAVGMILEDRSTAIWKLKGGTASRRQKGMAGPDLSMTGETLERVGRQCKDSKLFFVSAAESVEWGLVYDLAASSQRLEKYRFEKMVLLNEIPTPGQKVEFK